MGYKVDAKDPACTRAKTAHRDDVTCLAFRRAQHALLASGSDDGMVGCGAKSIPSAGQVEQELRFDFAVSCLRWVGTGTDLQRQG